MADSVVNKKNLAHLYKKEISMDNQGEELLVRLGEDFFARVVLLACEAAGARNAHSLEIEDIKFILEKYWDIRVPEYEKEDGYKPPRVANARAKRETQSRKYPQRLPKNTNS